MDRSSSFEFLLLRIVIFFWNLVHPRRALRVGRDKRTLRAEARRFTRVFGGTASEGGALARAEAGLAGSKRDLVPSRASAVLIKRRLRRPLTSSERSYRPATVDDLRGSLGHILHLQQGQGPVAAPDASSLDRIVEGTIGLLAGRSATPADLAVEFAPVGCSRFDPLVNRPGHNPVFEQLDKDLRGARSHINIAMYGWRDEDGNPLGTARRMADLLAAKVREGVAVTLLYDAFGCGIYGPRENQHCRRLFERMVEQGITCIPNDPWNLDRPDDLMRLDHRKLYVIDGRIAYVGGMGVEDKFDNDDPGKNCHDVMARLEGEVVSQFQCAFLRSLAYQLAYGSVSVSTRHLPDDRETLRRRYFPPRGAPGGRPARCLMNTPVAGLGQINEQYERMIAGARQHVYVMNPYCSDDRIARALGRSARRHERAGLAWACGRPWKEARGVLGLFPGGEMSPLERASKRCEFPDLVSAGMAILLYKEGWLHGKLAVQDGRTAVIGSCNLDFTSFSRNWEIAVCVEDEAAAQRVIEETFLRDEPPRSQEAPTRFSLATRIKYWVLDRVDRLF